MRTKQVLLLMSAVSTAACAERGPELRQPVGQTMVASPPGRGAHAATPNDSPDDVEGYLKGRNGGPCGMNELPVIEFASKELGEQEKLQLKRLAGCLTAAPYEKTSIVLVGHTDVVGTAPANLELGLERATTVMKHLIDGGVSPGRIVVASAGELQRPRERWGVRAPRVEVLLARGGPAHANEAPIARGIDAEGLLPRPRSEVVSRDPPGRLMPPPQPPPMRMLPQQQPGSFVPPPLPRSR
jgi:outer membrane protein OmpA-like peptidoglycan-associated protein